MNSTSVGQGPAIELSLVKLVILVAGFLLRAFEFYENHQEQVWDFWSRLLS